ncbi:TonB dependent receptor [Paludibacter sp.]|uniref:TonB dependent receptor n=1 Tax=Paludibacter sp. TaxID=1898105 RepID=UPI001353C996|nr:TonB dependent receptor [Paludibacter sp.]MTK52957.1 outer membrane beta-barrel protein [Paludibacter sp.]
MATKTCLQRIASFMLMAMLCIGIAKADGTVKGRILDQNHRPVEFATAALINAKTKLPIKGSESNSTGDFVIDKVHEGTYILSVTMVGYKKFETEQFAFNGKKDVQRDVVLEENTQMLKEATVVAKRKFIEQQADKMVINPEASITTASENVLDILKKTPGVTVDNNNNISLKGKEGVKVMIDDKPTYVSADQLATLLKGMQGKDIERIEVIENPSSRYDAEGNSGIINIKTKHNKRTGFNGSFYTGGGYSGKFGENVGLDLNMNFGKLNVYGNYSFNGWSGWNTMDAVRNYVTGPYVGAVQQIYNRSDYNGNGHNYKIGSDYYVAKNQVISFMVRGSDGHSNGKTNSVTSFFDNTMKLDSALHTKSGENEHWSNITFNGNYKWDIDSTGTSLTFDADYARFKYHSSTDQHGNYVDGNGNDMNINSTILGYQPRIINIFTAKTDYVHPIGKKFSIEGGLKTSFVKTNSQSEFTVDDPTNVVWNTGLKPYDQFIYTENINAAYVSARGQFGKTSVQLGLRVENTNSKGDSKSMNRVDTKHYTDLFPSLFIKRDLNENNQLGLTYSYRIGRPSYQILNPFMWLLDQFTYNQGNPFIRPQFTHSLGLNYTYKSKFITSIGMNRTNDLFTDVIKQNDITKVMYQTKDNLSKSIDLNASQTVQLDVTKWWHFNASAIVMYKSVTSNDATADKFKRWSYNANTTQSFTLPCDISMELAGRYRSKQLWGNFTIYEQYSVDLGVQKSLFNKKGTLKVSVDDIFNTNKGGGFAKYGNVDFNVDNHWDSRGVNVSFTYRFGKDSFKTRANRSTASSEEQSRSGK